MEINKIINSIEQIFRYILSGVVFYFIYRLSVVRYPSDSFADLDSVYYIFYLSALGMVVYAIHRLIYWAIIDWILFAINLSALSEYGKRYWEAIGLYQRKLLKEEFNAKKSYLYYRFSLIHFGLITSEITIVFTVFFSTPNSFLHSNKCNILIAGVVFFAISLMNYIVTHKSAKYIL